MHLSMYKEVDPIFTLSGWFLSTLFESTRPKKKYQNTRKSTKSLPSPPLNPPTPLLSVLFHFFSGGLPSPRELLLHTYSFFQSRLSKFQLHTSSFTPLLGFPFGFSSLLLSILFTSTSHSYQFLFRTALIYTFLKLLPSPFSSFPSILMKKSLSNITKCEKCKTNEKV